MTALLPRGALPERAPAVVSAVAGKINLMPVYLGLPILGATVLLDLWMTGFGLRHTTAASKRIRDLATAPGSRGPFRDLVLLYERLSAFVYYTGAADPGTAPPTQSGEAPRPAAPMAHSCEVLVIGSGPGGSVTAATLARAGYDVLLVEEGPDTRRISTPPYSSREMDEKYRNGGLTPCLGKARLTYAEARCLGGGSEVNSGMFHRLPESVFAEWRTSNALPDLTAAALEPYYADVIARLSIGPVHGGEGLASLKLGEGADKLGWASEEVPRWINSRRDADGRWHSTRVGMSVSFVADAIAAGCRVLTNIAVEKISMAGNGDGVASARSVNGYVPGENISIRFKWVFICAGAIGTPALLRRSGIKRNVGNSLQLHPMLRTVARFDEDVNENEFGVPVRQVVEFKPDLTLGCSMSSLPHLALWMAGRPADFEIRQEMNRMAVFYALIRSSARGRIRNLPFFAEPLVSWTLAPEDYRALGDGLSKLCKLLLVAGAKEIFLPMGDPAPITSMEGLGERLTRLAELQPEVTAIHLFGSCPLGGDQDRFPLDPYGKVCGFDNLFVNDASMLPGTTGVNPQATIMAVALRNIAAFLESTRPGG